jgi:hypothetical protein
MSARHSWLARTLFGAALRLMPRERRDWAHAMRAEAPHVSEDERLHWALGCFWTAIRLRFDPMNTGDLRVSRWVMLVESLGAFGPLCLGWYTLVFISPGLLHLNGAMIDGFVRSVAGGGFIIAMTIVGGVVGLVGPVGIFLGLRYVLTGRALENRALGWTLIVIPVSAHLFGMVAGVIAGPPDFEYNAFAFWFYTVMMTFVPVAVIYHLMVLAQPARPAAPLAVAA